MSDLILPGSSIALSGASSLFQFGQKRTAADIQKRESEISAKQIELAATQREADRKGRLARALASQTASAGARGIAAFEGSPLSVLQADIAEEEKATGRDIFQSRLAAMTTRARGRIAERQLKTGAAVGLIGDIGKLAGTAAQFSGGGS